MNHYKTKTIAKLSLILLAIALISTSPTVKAGDKQTSNTTPTTRGTLFQWSPNVTGGPDLNTPLITDRPDFTESTVTVGKGVAQIELGYTYLDTGDSDAHSLGEPLLRYGILAEWLELRLGIFPLEESGETGFSDLYFGFKIALSPQDGWLPEMALIPQTYAPTGSDSFTSDHWEPGINWTYGWQINDFLSTAGSSQINQRFAEGNGNGGGDSDDFLRLAQSWTLAFSLNKKIGAYTEWFALFPLGSNGAKNEHYINGGFTYLINNDLQFDVRVGWGLNDASEDFFAGAGLSVRFQ